MKPFPEKFSVIVKDTPYTVILKDRLPRMGLKHGTDGICDPEKCEVLIRRSLTAERALEVLVHEYLHAIEFEYNIKIPHEMIKKLEGPISRLLLDNYL